MMEDPPNPNPDPVDAFIQPSDPPPELVMEDTIQAVDSNPSLGEPDPEAGSGAGVSKLSLLVPKSPSFPFLLRRVMDAEMAMAEGGLGFLALGVHAAFLDSGFAVSGGNDWTRFPGGFVPSSNNISVQYTVPDLVGTCDAGGAENNGKVAVLKFSAIKNFASVYGIVGGDRPVVHHVCLDVERFVPSLLSTVEVMRWSDEKDVLEFSKVVKDELCLPLMIDLCEKNGLSLPPCFLRLPTELKEKILELLPSVGLARTSCVSSELRELSSNDELWKQRFEKEFGELPADEEFGKLPADEVRPVRLSMRTLCKIKFGELPATELNERILSYKLWKQKLEKDSGELPAAGEIRTFKETSWKNKFGIYWRRRMMHSDSKRQV